MLNKPEYTRFLPHYHPIGATFFVTTRLHGSLPQSFIDTLSDWYTSEKERIAALPSHPDRLKALELLQRDHFRKFDRALDQCLCGPTFLKDPAAAYQFTKQLTRFDGRFYHLLAYTVLSNHVHILLDFSAQSTEKRDLPAYKNLDYAMDRVKGASSRYINLALNRTGEPCWQVEYHDRYIRDRRHLLAAVDYIKQNPVSVGLCPHWREHAYTWVHERFW